MMAGIDKQQVERQFSRAASTYDEAAKVQHQMSDQLLQMICRQLAKPPKRILDLGCGTGYSMAQLQQIFPQARLTGLDLSHQMLTRARDRVPAADFIQADMENFQPGVRFDLVFSNASIQWCDLFPVLQTVKNSLKPGGYFAYSSFGPATHREIAKAWNTAQPGKVHHIDFLSESDHLNALKQSGFELVGQQKQLLQPTFDSLPELLSSVKKTGATNAASKRDKGLLSRHTYARFLASLGQQSPLALSYEAISFVTRIPEQESQ